MVGKYLAIGAIAALSVAAGLVAPPMLQTRLWKRLTSLDRLAPAH